MNEQIILAECRAIIRDELASLKNRIEALAMLDEVPDTLRSEDISLTK